MTDALLPILLLAIISLSLAVMAITLALVAWDMRRLLRRVEGILPACDQALREAHQVFRQTRQLVKHGTTTAHYIEDLIQKTCGVAEMIVDRVIRLKDRAEEFVEARFGNGAKAELRRHRRR